nr:hypothetical protein [Tanacetum cinerariifolium]
MMQWKTVVVTSDPLAWIAEKTNTDNKKVEKKDDEKKRDMSRVKCYNCKKEGHFAKDCKKAKKIDVPFTSAAHVLTVGHNAKKRKTSNSNWKGKATKGKFNSRSKRKAESEIAPTSDPKEAMCFYCNTKGN